MSFFMSFALGGAKEFNAMSEEERAAKAAEAKRKAEARAEEIKFGREQSAKIADEMRAEETKKREEARAAEKAQQEKRQKLSNAGYNLSQYYQAEPNKYHFVDLNTYQIQSFNMPAEYFTEADAIAKSIYLNSNLEEFGTQYFPELVEGTTDKFKIGYRDAKENNNILFTDAIEAEKKAEELNKLRGPDSPLISFSESTADSTGFRVVTKQKTATEPKEILYKTAEEVNEARPTILEAAGLTEDTGEIELETVPGGFKVKAVPKKADKESLGPVYTTIAEVNEARPQLIAAAGLTEETANFKVKSVSGGFQVDVEPKTEQEKGPPRDEETDLPLTPNFYFARDLGSDIAKDPMKFSAQVIDLTPDRSLPMSGQEMKSKKRGRDYTFGRRSTAAGTIQNSQENLRILLKDEFTPQVIDRAIEIYDSNPQALDYFVGTLPPLIDSWQLATADQVEGSVRKLRPVLSYYPELIQYAEKHPKIREALKKAGISERVIGIANARNGVAVNAPAEPTEDGGANLLDIPIVTDAFGVDTGQQDEEGNDIITLQDNFLQTTRSIGTNSGMGHPKVLKLLESAQNPRTRQSNPEATQEAFTAMKENRKLLSTETFVEPTASGTELQFRFPSLLTNDRTKLVNNLSHYPTHNDKILALRTAIPSASINTALSYTDIGGGLDAKARYEDITGNNNYDGMEARYRKAEQVLSTHSQLVQLLSPATEGGAGAPVGIPLQIERLKAGAQYLLQTLGGIDTAQVSTEAGQIVESRVSGSDVIRNLTQQFTSIQGSEESQLAALVNLNIKMQSYAYAAMMDPNGRLSDQDREQADQAISAGGYTANPASVIAVSSRLAERAEFTMATIEGYTGGDTAQIIATHYYNRLAPGAQTDVRRFLGRATGVTSQETLQQQAVDDSAILNMYGGGQQEAPVAPVQTPTESQRQPVPAPAPEQRPGNQL